MTSQMGQKVSINIINEYADLPIADLKEIMTPDIFFQLLKKVSSNIDQFVLHNKLYKLDHIVELFIQNDNYVHELVNFLGESRLHTILKNRLFYLLCIKYVMISKKFANICIQNFGDGMPLNNIDYVVNNIIEYKDPELTCNLIKKIMAFTNNLEEYVIITKLPLDIHVLETLCMYSMNNKYNIIKSVMEQKIIPNQKCYRGIIKHGFNCITTNKNHDDENTFFNVLVRLLVEGGYSLKEEDIKFAAKNYVVLENCYNIDINDNIRKCYLKLMIRFFSLSGYMSLIEKIIAIYGIEPNHLCLKNAILSGNKKGKNFIQRNYPYVIDG